MKEIIDNDKLLRTVRRMSHEIIERNNNLSNIILLGVLKNGVPLAKMIRDNILKFEEIDIPLYELDITGYRDDIKVEEYQKLHIDISNKDIILVDDVLYTGRTVRASLDAIIDLGRPNAVQLAVLVDRGHRELPIRADYVGKNIPTASDETVIVNFKDDLGVHIGNK